MTVVQFFLLRVSVAVVSTWAVWVLAMPDDPTGATVGGIGAAAAANLLEAIAVTRA